jgi:hypothetical protein
MRDHSASIISATPQQRRRVPATAAISAVTKWMSLGAWPVRLGNPCGKKRYFK